MRRLLWSTMFARLEVRIELRKADERRAVDLPKEVLSDGWIVGIQWRSGVGKVGIEEGHS
jgi:hypothetical protein